MRALTNQEQIDLEARQKRFAAMMSEISPVLTNFAQALDLPNPQKIIEDPNSYVAGIGSFIQAQDISKEDWTWIVARIGYFIGQVLNQRLTGHWFLNDLPDTRFFLRCVVGNFEHAKDKQAMVDPFEAAVGFLKQPPKRCFSLFIMQIEQDLLAGRSWLNLN